MKKFLALFLALMLALSVAACGTPEDTTPSTTGSTETTAPEATVLGDGATVIYFSTTDLEGNQAHFEIHTDAATVGEALEALGLIEGSEGPYGLMVETVNGVTVTWEADGAYWGFFIDGEYALTGVDETELTPGATYALNATKG